MDRAQALRLFQAHNRARLHRLIELAPHKQAIFFRLLPVLFHLNHKLLPGYVSDDCPAGIMDYQPDNDALHSAILLNRNFQYRRTALQRYALRGLYLINPAGQIRYREAPSFELWLVHHTSIKTDDLAKLQHKAELIQQWAAELGITLQYRMLDETHCHDQHISPEQRQQFYLQGLCLAGSVPLWWLITTEEQTSYAEVAERLLSQRGLTQISLLDFGENLALTADDIFLSAVAALEHAAQGELPALLDLLFLQQQISLFPNVISLPERYKEQIEQGEVDTLLVEAASLQLAAIERIADADKQLLARQAFYALSAERLSHPVRYPLYPWRRHSLQNLNTRWQWSAEMLTAEDNRPAQPFQQRRKWWGSMLPLLQEFLQQLQQFAKQHLPHQLAKTNALQRRLELLTTDPANLIKQLPPGLQQQDGAKQLYLYRFAQQDHWKLSTAPLTDSSQLAMQQHRSLLHLLLWAICNHLLTVHSRLRITDQKQRVHTKMVLELIQTLLKSPLTAFRSPIRSEQLLIAPRTEALLLFANLYGTTHELPKNDAIQLANLNTDPLSYTATRQNLVDSIDIVIGNSWGQWQLFQFHGEDAVPLALAHIIRSNPVAELAQQLSSWCAPGFFAKAINTRLQRLCVTVLTHYGANQQQGRYLIKLDQRLLQLQWLDGVVTVKTFAAGKSLRQALAEEQKHYLPTKIDQYLDPDNLLNSLLHYQHPATCNLFAQRMMDITQLVVVDDLGRLQQFTYPPLLESQLLGKIQSFLQRTLLQQPLHYQCFQLVQQQQYWHIQPAQPQQPATAALSVIWQIDSAQLTIHLQSSSIQIAWGDPQIPQLLNNLFMQQGEQKPAYYFVDQLQFVPNKHYSSLFFLSQKHALEQQFNQAGL